MKEEVNNIDMNFQEYKNQDKNYINHMQKFLDLVDNIQDEKLKRSIIYQKIKCDEVLEDLMYKFLNK